MAELIDRNAFRDFWNKNYRHQYANDTFLFAIANFPTTDAVPVVRCKDCRYRIHDEVTNEWFCNSFHSGFVYAKPNDFCSYGERKDPDD